MYFLHIVFCSDCGDVFMNKKYENINMKMYDYMKIQNKNVQDRVALEYFGREYTFKEVINNIDLVFNGLRNLGIKKSDEVCVLGLSTLEFVFVLYAVNRIGSSLTILNPIDTSGYDKIFSRIKPINKKNINDILIKYFKKGKAK